MEKFPLSQKNAKILYNLTENLKILHNLLKICFLTRYAIFTTLIQDGCFSEALHAKPGKNKATEVSMSFKSFTVTGEDSDSQAVVCYVKLCINECQKPTEDEQCPNEGTQQLFIYSVAGFTG